MAPLLVRGYAGTMSGDFKGLALTDSKKSFYDNDFLEGIAMGYEVGVCFLWRPVKQHRAQSVELL